MAGTFLVTVRLGFNSDRANWSTEMDRNSHVGLRSGNEMPVMGLGTWKLTKDTPGAVAAAPALRLPWPAGRGRFFLP